MIRRPPISTRTDTLFPYTTLFRSNRLLATVLVQEGDVRSYALEGSVFVAGSLIKWLRDGLGLLANAGESEALARSVADNGGVYLVPALTGLGAAHWRPASLAALPGDRNSDA